MSEEPPRSPGLNASADPASPLPEPKQIPTDLVAKWVTIPAGAPIEATFTKGDLDHLYFSLLRSGASNIALLDSLTLYTNGHQDLANAKFAEARKLNADALNHAVEFMTSLVGKALGS